MNDDVNVCGSAPVGMNVRLCMVKAGALRSTTSGAGTLYWPGAGALARSSANPPRFERAAMVYLGASPTLAGSEYVLGAGTASRLRSLVRDPVVGQPHRKPLAAPAPMENAGALVSFGGATFSGLYAPGAGVWSGACSLARPATLYLGVPSLPVRPTLGSTRYAGPGPGVFRKSGFGRPARRQRRSPARSATHWRQR